MGKTRIRRGKLNLVGLDEPDREAESVLELEVTISKAQRDYMRGVRQWLSESAADKSVVVGGLRRTAMEHIEEMNDEERLECLKSVLPDIENPWQREAATWAAGEIIRLRAIAERGKRPSIRQALKVIHDAGGYRWDGVDVEAAIAQLRGTDICDKLITLQAENERLRVESRRVWQIMDKAAEAARKEDT